MQQRNMEQRGAPTRPKARRIPALVGLFLGAVLWNLFPAASTAQVPGASASAPAASEAAWYVGAGGGQVAYGAAAAWQARVFAQFDATRRFDVQFGVRGWQRGLPEANQWAASLGLRALFWPLRAQQPAARVAPYVAVGLEQLFVHTEPLYTSLAAEQQLHPTPVAHAGLAIDLTPAAALYVEGGYTHVGAASIPGADEESGYWSAEAGLRIRMRGRSPQAPPTPRRPAVAVEPAREAPKVEAAATAPPALQLAAMAATPTAMPEPAATPATGPETTGPETTGPETAGPETAGPEAAGSEAAGPEREGSTTESPAVPVVPEPSSKAPSSDAPSSDAPATEAAAPQLGGVDPSAGGYTLIVGSGLERPTTEGTARTYLGLGYPVSVLEETVERRQRYRIAVGQFESTAAARQALSRLAGRLPQGSWVLRL